MKKWKEIVKDYPNHIFDKDLKETRLRFSALSEIEEFVENEYPELNNGKIYLKDIDKNKLRISYAEWKQKELNGAEKQVFNDLYNMLEKLT